MPNYNIDSQTVFTRQTLEKFEDFAWLFFYREKTRTRHRLYVQIKHV